MHVKEERTDAPRRRHREVVGWVTPTRPTRARVPINSRACTPRTTTSRWLVATRHRGSGSNSGCSGQEPGGRAAPRNGADRALKAEVGLEWLFAASTAS